MKGISMVLPHLLLQLVTALLASGGAILYTFSEIPGLVLLGLFLLFQLITYLAIKGVSSFAQQHQQPLWLMVVQRVVATLFVVMLLTICAVILWVVFEFSIWHLSGNGGGSYTLYLEHVAVSVVPQVVEVLVLGEVLRQVGAWLINRQWAGQNITTSD